MFAEEIKLASESGKEAEGSGAAMFPPLSVVTPYSSRLSRPNCWQNGKHTHRVWGGSVPLIIDITQCTKSALLL